ncbi:expressed unknown protein [Seminavis robusta]|uniref:Uncharacterized protein n=1 Tax=Seminavis robusta TaxID=568900 RepID=A0A9N8DMZ1_9STRA|nr:expressed unknown protein [Seminavis robusta]|eukprot:Sro144_g067030.1 n/a (150) ;mRNA; r:63652-64244
MIQPRRVIFWIFCLLLLTTVKGQYNSEEDIDRRGPLQALREKFDELPSGAKVATSAGAGFVTSRVALKTFVSAAKVAGAAFIATEVLSVSGVLDNMPDFLEDQVQSAKNVKDRCLMEANKLRKGFRETLQKEKLAGLGFACGAFVGMAV